MPPPRSSAMGRFFSRLWWLVDGTRRLVFNLLFLLVVVLVIAALAASGTPPLQDKTALVLNLRGPLVEQHAQGVRDAAVAQLSGELPTSTQLRDLIHVLDAAARDPQIAHAVLVLDDFKGGGLASLRDAAAALQRFRASGKKVIAWGGSYDQRQYFLAAQADELLLHPMGMVFLQGYGSPQTYYRDALDKLGVSVEVVRVGTYKNFGEQFTLNGPSAESVEANTALYGGLWSTYLNGIETARKLPPGAVMSLINALPERLAAVKGNPAQLALDSKLVDGLKTRDELRQLMIERGAKDRDGTTFRQVSYEQYLARQTPSSAGTAAAVGMVVAEGEIVDGAAPAGSVGGVSTAELIRKARQNNDIKALLLRVNSPGGSVYGSELIRREVELTRAAGKPVVVSMGDVAASGGYWISMGADEVLADAGTITGSIGVFSIVPNAEQALHKLGVHSAGVSTTWLGHAGDPRVPPDPRFVQLMQSTINHVYAEFTGRAAEARKTTPEKIDAVAQGRVWTGAQAHERGLVDGLGGYTQALQSAARRAGLGEQPRLIVLQPEPGRAERLLSWLNTRVLQMVGAAVQEQTALPGVPATLVQQARQDFGWLNRVGNGQAPFTAVTHCLCTPP